MSELNARLIEREERIRQAAEAYFAMLKEEERQHEGTPKAALSKGTGKRTRHPGERGKANAARWAILNRFVDTHMQALPIQATAVWLSLFRHADGTGAVSRALPVLALDTGLSLYSVRKGIAALEAAGLLSIKLKGNNYGGQYTVTCYKLTKIR